MRRELVIALLILFSVPAAAGSHPATPYEDPLPTAAAESTQLSIPIIELLVLQSNRKTHFMTQSLDVAASVAIQRDDAIARLDRYTFDAQMESADTDNERRIIVRSAINLAEIRYFGLREREKSLRSAYRDGSIDTPAYVRGLARTKARAAGLQKYLDAIDARTEGNDERLDTRLQKLTNRLVEFQGPVRDRARSSVQGQAAPIRLYVSVSPNGTVLSMITDDRYVREAYRDDKQTDSSIRITLDRALDLMESNYPETADVSQSSGINYLLGAGVHRLEIRPAEFTLTSYLHGGTEEIYFEVREVRLSAAGATPGKAVTANGTRLVVNRSYRGGPLRIATYDNATGNPVDATVIVEDIQLETRADGVIWTLTPDTVQFSVTVLRPRGNVVMLVRPLELDPADNGT